MLDYSGDLTLRIPDELDDVAGLCRHVATIAAYEVAALSAPLITTATATVGLWLLLPLLRR